MQEELLQLKMQKEEGIDYDEVFAPVARIEAIRLFLAYASFMGFMVYQIDVKIAFLYGTIEEEVYVCQPPGFEDPDYPDKVYKMVKAAYGLHQAPRAWYETLANYLLENYFPTGKIDQTLFIKKQKDGKSASTPIDTEKPLLKDPDGKDVDVHTYRSMIGSLMYLTSSRPDIMFAVCTCARFQVTPKALHLHAVKRIFSIDCLPNAEIFAELERMGYEKPSTKLTFYEAFFLAQWKFLIHTILQYMSVKRTAWNEFSSSMALTVICLATGRRFNFLKYSLVRNVDSSSKFYMVGKGFSRVDTPLFEGMLVPQQAHDVAADDIADDVADAAAEDENVVEPTSPTPATTPPQKELLPSTSQVAPTLPQSPIAPPSSLLPQQQPSLPSQPSHDATISMDLLNTLLETCTTLTRRVENLEQDKIAQALEITKLKKMVRRLEKKRKKIAKLDADEDVTLEEVAAEVPKDADAQGRQEESQAQVYHIDLKHADKVLSVQDDKPEPTKLKEVIKVVTTAKLMTEVVTAAASTIIAALSAARRRKGVVIRDPKEIATPSTIVHSEPKSKDKGKGMLVQEPKPLKKQAQIEQDKAYARELEAELNKNINWNDVIEFKMDFFKGMSYDDIRPIFEKHFNSIVGFLEKGEEQLEKEASKALKRKSKSSKQQAAKKQKLNKENFDREDLKMLWQIVQARFASSERKNFSDDFLLTTLKAMFKKPNVEAHIWKNQKGRYGLAKVKSWKLLEPYQMLNNVRLKVEEESEVSLELLQFVRRQQQEGYKPNFGVDAVEDFKEYTQRDYYCWLKTYRYWYKLKLLDNAAESRLRLLEESAAADDKIKKYTK
uniref:Reverse transcriptase Ty1/copia-type domain-containing protein n=1 Tax=Tanacetum cinerariifolium TaxID=118510 RepID=A0A6L2LUA8_TANCI|nr:hypothetical protein [Tanacetum cinerariifolium]